MPLAPLGAAEAQSPAQAKYSWVAMRNFNQAADNNKAPILKELQRLFSAPGKLLEIGSGSGQHAMHMANLLPGVIWQPTEVSGNLPHLAENLSAAHCSSLMEPLELEASGKIAGFKSWSHKTGWDGFFAVRLVVG